MWMDWWKTSHAVRWLVIANVVVFVVGFILQIALWQTGRYPYHNQLFDVFALSSEGVFGRGWIWQLFTYLFLHGGFWHLFFNMFALIMFGTELEELWGHKEFLKYYFFCGIGAGIFIILLPVILSQPAHLTVGSSGAIFGLLLAYAVYWPERRILLFFVIPIKVKYFVLLLGLLTFYLTLENGHLSEISHVGHLGGLVTGYFYLLWKLGKKRGTSSFYLSLKNPAALFSRKGQKREILNEDLTNEQKLDLILEKISRHGLKSLSSAEKKFLEEMSEKFGSKNT